MNSILAAASSQQTFLLYSVLMCMGEKRSFYSSRKEQSMLPKQFSLLFSNIFKVEVFTTATLFSKTITQCDSV